MTQDKAAFARDGLSRRTLLGAAGAVLAGGGLAAAGLGVPRAQASVSGDYAAPVLEFGDPATQARLGRPYQDALTDLIEINTVPADPTVYNRSGLVSYPPGTFVRAGGGYREPQRWTRDCAVNAWNAGSLLGPVVGRNTLWAVVDRRADGSLVVQQDNQWWDQIVWVSAAWHHYLVTGDQAFLVDAYQASVNTLAQRKARNFNSHYGLFEGPGYMNDGIAGYPSPPWEPGIRSSFVLHYPNTDRLMCLSSNCLYYAAYVALAGMADALGRKAEAAAHRRAGNHVRAAINRHLWRREAGLYGYFIHGGGELRDQLDIHEEGAGLAFAVLLGVASPAQARQVLDNAHWQPRGVVNVWPHFDRFDEQHPGRHEVVVWPNVHAFFGDAAAFGRRTDLFARAVDDLATLVSGSNGNFFELYNSLTGAVDGGWQTDSTGRIVHSESQPNQAWSATGYLRMIYSGLFGLRFTPWELCIAPVLPPGWGPVVLSGLPYRDMTLDITLTGAGNRAKSFTFDGRPGPARRGSRRASRVAIRSRSNSTPCEAAMRGSDDETMPMNDRAKECAVQHQPSPGISRRSLLGAAAAAGGVLAANIHPAGVAAAENVSAGQAGAVPPSGRGGHYVPNRDPLAAVPFQRLPPGAVRARGWLAGQLALQVDGMAGRYDEVSHFLVYDNSGWVDSAKGGWEELPYWLRGLGDLGYVTGDQRILGKAERWIDGVIATQAPDGWFGPARLRESLEGGPDFWPGMPLLSALRSWQEYSGDERVVPFVLRYLRFQHAQPPEVYGRSWGAFRWGDNIDTAYWVYNRTGESWLLDLVEKMHDNSADYTNGLPTRHNVNLAQGFREPLQFGLLAGAPSYAQATYRNYAEIMAAYGQFPGGGFAGDENFRPTYGDPRQGFETCGIVEFMHSFEMLTRYTGDTVWADRCEELAFNMLPAAFDPRQRAIHYITAANCVHLDDTVKHGQFQNAFPMLAYKTGVDQYRCCPHNYGSAVDRVRRRGGG